MQRLEEMRGYVERWVNVAGFFAPFFLLVLGAFVLIKSMFGFNTVMDDFYEGQKSGKDVKTMIAEDQQRLKFQREQKYQGTVTTEQVQKIEDEIFNKDYLINDLKKQQKQAASKSRHLEEEEMELKKLDPTQDFLQSVISTDGVKVVSDQQLAAVDSQNAPGFMLFPPTEEQLHEPKTIEKPKEQKQILAKQTQTQTQKPKKSDKPDKVFAFQVDQSTSEKRAEVEVGRPWWHDLDKFSIVQFKLREDDVAMPLYIDTNFEQEQSLDRQPVITIIAFESFQEAVDFYKYMVPRWKFDAEQGGEYPMWSEVEKMDIQQLKPMEFLEEIEHLGYRLEVIPKGQIEFSGEMTYADFYERVLTVCKIPGWEEVVMEHATWDDYDNDLEGAVKRQKEDVQYTGPGSLEGAKGFTVL